MPENIRFNQLIATFLQISVVQTLVTSLHFALLFVPLLVNVGTQEYSFIVCIVTDMAWLFYWSELSDREQELADFLRAEATNDHTRAGSAMTVVGDGLEKEAVSRYVNQSLLYEIISLSLSGKNRIFNFSISVNQQIHFMICTTLVSSWPISVQYCYARLLHIDWSLRQAK